jgi:hypothetical protein
VRTKKSKIVDKCVKKKAAGRVLKLFQAEPPYLGFVKQIDRKRQQS